MLIVGFGGGEGDVLVSICSMDGERKKKCCKKFKKKGKTNCKKCPRVFE